MKKTLLVDVPIVEDHSEDGLICIDSYAADVQGGVDYRIALQQLASPYFTLSLWQASAEHGFGPALFSQPHEDYSITDDTSDHVAYMMQAWRAWGEEIGAEVIFGPFEQQSEAL